MKLIPILLLLLGCLLGIPSAFSYQPAFQALNVDNGLTMNTVNDLVTDRQGFLWIATEAGLNRFDGKKIQGFTASQAPFGPSTNDITQLYTSAAGDLWILTENAGLNLYQPKDGSFKVFGSDAGISSADFTGVGEDLEGNLWISTDTQGIQIFSKSQSRVIKNLSTQSTPAIPTDKVLGLISDKNGGFWINSSAGVSHLSANGINKRLPTLSDLTVSTMAIAADGTLWLGTNDRELVRYNAKNAEIQRFSNIKNTLPQTSFTDIKLDEKGHLWIATSTEGLVRLNPQTGKIERFVHAGTNQLSLTSQNLTKLCIDDNQQLWIGTRSSGLARMSISAENFHRIHDKSFSADNLINPDTRSIYRDKLGQLWIGTSAGLMRAIENEEGQITGFTPHGLNFPVLDQSFISFIHEDEHNNFWIGTRGDGLIVFNADKTKIDQFLHNPNDPASIPSNSFYSLFVDSKLNHWITTLDGGITRVNLAKRSFQSISKKNTNKLLEDEISDIAEANDGSLWVSTYGAGLTVIDSQGVNRHFNTKTTPALPSDHLLSINKTNDGKMWIGSENGIFSFDPLTLELKHFDKNQGLIGNVVYLSVLDNDDNLWAGSTNGLSVINTRSGKIRNYTKQDGLQGNEFNLGAAFVDKDGTVYLGGTNGFNKIHPNSLPKKHAPRAPIVDEFLLMNKPQNLAQISSNTKDSINSITLNYSDILFSFGYQSPALFDAEQLTYQYRMLGLEEQWLTTLNLQKSSFTGLSPGRYQYEVRAQNLDGEYSPTTSIDITITPAPWQTWWAYCLYIGILFALLALIGYISLSKYRSKMQMMQQVVVSEQRLQQALWSSGDEFWDWEITHNRLTRSNAFLEYPKAEQSPPLSYSSIIHPEDLPMVTETMDGCLNHGQDEFEMSYRGKTRNGDWLWVIERGKVISRDEQGNPNHIMGTIQNAQRLKEAQEALRNLNAELEHRVLKRTDELLQKNEQLNTTLDELTCTRNELVDKEKMATLGGLVASITHEVNTPIGISVTAASHLKDRVSEFSKAFNNGEVDESDFTQYQSEVSDCCKLMLTNLERAAKLISSFKKVSVDQSHDELRDFDLSQYLEEIFLSLNPLLSRSGHSYGYKCPPQLYINSNPGIFYQIISNLFNNSIVHAYPDGKAGKLELMIRQTDNGIEVDYRDDGCGMNEEVQQHIFHPFYTTKRGKGGSGLGMNIVYNLVHQVLGGEIKLFSAPGEGARFVITLPNTILVK